MPALAREWRRKRKTRPSCEGRVSERREGAGDAAPGDGSGRDGRRSRLEGGLRGRLLERLGDPHEAEACDQGEDPHAREEAGDPEAQLQRGGRGGADAEVRDQGETGRAPCLVASLALDRVGPVELAEV